ncbi:MAG TPA: hypothetical protein VF541_19985 [Longimicrobium sp.]
MDYAKVWQGSPPLSPAEIVILGILAVLCLAAGWTLYQKMSGRGKSDVSDLRFTHRK